MLRSDFITAVDRAVAAVPELPAEAAEKLRSVPRDPRVTEFAKSSFCIAGVGCPATVAGVYDPIDPSGYKSAVMAFAMEFDRVLLWDFDQRGGEKIVAVEDDA